MSKLWFFSSRSRHTSCYRDWSSDVCSSDLECRHSDRLTPQSHPAVMCPSTQSVGIPPWTDARIEAVGRSEERRVGKECRVRRDTYHFHERSATIGDGRVTREILVLARDVDD